MARDANTHISFPVYRDICLFFFNLHIAFYVYRFNPYQFYVKVKRKTTHPIHPIHALWPRTNCDLGWGDVRVLASVQNCSLLVQSGSGSDLGSRFVDTGIYIRAYLSIHKPLLRKMKKKKQIFPYTVPSVWTFSTSSDRQWPNTGTPVDCFHTFFFINCRLDVSWNSGVIPTPYSIV